MKDARFLKSNGSQKPEDINLESLHVWVEENEPVQNNKPAEFKIEKDVWSDLDTLFN